MTPLWRYLTQAAGMTAQMLADAAGMTIQAARADLAQLESDGKACRERAAIGKPHLWWRIGSRPLEDLDVLLIMALAADYHAAPASVREVMQKVSARAKNPAIRQIVGMCATSKYPHQIVWAALDEYVAEDLAQRAA